MNSTITTASLKKLLLLNPKAFFYPLILLHGTSKDNLNKILKQGLKSQDGYSTVTLNSNVAYSLYAKQDMAYGASGEREKSTGILLVLLPTLHPGPGHNADVFLDKENKNIDGNIPMWVKGNLGFYLSKDYKFNPKKQITIDPKNIIAGLNISTELGNIFEKIKKAVSEGKINKGKWEKYFFDYLSGRQKELFRAEYIQKVISGGVEATVVSQVVEIIRRATLSLALHRGWSIGGTAINSSNIKKKSKKSISVFFPVKYKKELSSITLPTEDKAINQIMIIRQLAQRKDNPALNYTVLSSRELERFFT